MPKQKTGFPLPFLAHAVYSSMFNEQNEIMGDWHEELALELAEDPASEEAMEAHYLDWCQRNGVIPELYPLGRGAGLDGTPVNVWGFR